MDCRSRGGSAIVSSTVEQHAGHEVFSGLSTSAASKLELVWSGEIDDKAELGPLHTSKRNTTGVFVKAVLGKRSSR